MSKQTFLTSYFILFLTVQLFGQAAGGSDASYELRDLIDLPTAGTLKKGNLGVSFYALPFGVLTSKIELGIIKNFSLGLSFGGANLIGSGKPDFYKRPGILGKFRFYTEARSFPSLTIGFNTQGKGQFIDSLDRYEIKSPGIYLASSKNYKFLGYLSFHGIINYSLEKKDNDENINFGAGIEKTIGPTISIILEYDLALNDNSNNSLGKNNGYLNAGLRWSASYGLTIGLDFKNLLDNKNHSINDGVERTLFIEFVRDIY